MKLEHFLTSYIKIILKWLKDLNIRQDIINLLNENTGKTFSDIGHSNIFFGHSSKSKEVKAKKKKKRNLTKLTSFQRAKETITKRNKIKS